MQYITFSNKEHSTYPVAILVPKLERPGMIKEYLDEGNMDFDEVIAYQLHQTGKKTKVTLQKEFLDEMLELLDDLQTEYILVSDGDYFKTLTGTKKADAYLGYVLPNAYPANMAGRFKVIYCPNYRQVFYDPKKARAKIKLAVDALWNHRHGAYEDPGHDVIHFSDYPQSFGAISKWLVTLMDMDCDLTCDIEAFSLKHYDAGIGTISFAWNQHEGIAFPVDFLKESKEIRAALARFFRDFKHRLIFHKISYDVTVLIYQLFMEHISDQEGLLDGLEVMLKNWDDSLLVTYLATNSCAGNKLGLKEQIQEFAGNYAQEEIKDITKIPMPELLEYNLVDTCGTWYALNKHWQTMVDDDQLEIYETLFKPAMVDIIQMQLTGIPLDMDEVAKARVLLEVDRDDALRRLDSYPLVAEFTYKLNEEWVEDKNNKLKVKRVSMDDANEVFNPNSAPQLQRFFYDFLGLPVIEKTKAKLPATKAEVLEKLKAYTEDQDVKDCIDALLDYKAVDKIYSTFIPAMETAQEDPNGDFYLFGNFNLGGTVSGRLSSSGPNLQTIPSSGTKYAKLIKACFKAPKGYLMIGLDFASLEDRISALTTKDPNKLKVYTDGYDGHSLRAYSYFGDQMPDIDPTSVDSINSIAAKYKPLRQASKMPTFLLTYGGTHIGMMAQGGFSMEEATQIEDRYHVLYRESDIWVQEKLDQASIDGYITGAFGLRVRTPLLAQVIRGNSATPFEAEAEGRTAGNALGQSWCLLNSRASVEFMDKVRAHELYRMLIRPIMHIHDAQYYIIPDDIEILMYVNEHLVKAVEWQDHPDIAHDQVKLGGELSVFYPSWAEEVELPNGASEPNIREKIMKHMDDLNSKKKAA